MFQKKYNGNSLTKIPLFPGDYVCIKYVFRNYFNGAICLKSSSNFRYLTILTDFEKEKYFALSKELVLVFFTLNVIP
jgi:hypothetical protein